jgi:hypothetical protein
MPRHHDRMHLRLGQAAQHDVPGSEILPGETKAPHVTQNDCITATGKRRRSAIAGRTTRHEGYYCNPPQRLANESAGVERHS